MKKLTANLKTILSGNKGETLMEGIVSIFLFTVVLVTVSTMIMTSNRMAWVSIASAGDRQGALNSAITSSTATTTSLLKLSGSGINVDINIEISAPSATFTSFRPVTPP